MCGMLRLTKQFHKAERVLKDQRLRHQQSERRGIHRDDSPCIDHVLERAVGCCGQTGFRCNLLGFGCEGRRLSDHDRWKGTRTCLESLWIRLCGGRSRPLLRQQGIVLILISIVILVVIVIFVSSLLATEHVVDPEVRIFEIVVHRDL